MKAAGWRNKIAGDSIGGIPTAMKDAIQLSEKEERSKESNLLIKVRDAFFVGSDIDESHLNID